MDLARECVDDEDFGDVQREIAGFLFNRIRKLETALADAILELQSITDGRVATIAKLKAVLDMDRGGLA